MNKYQDVLREWESLGDEIAYQIQNLSPSEREDSFYKKLEFGTGGLRGLLGVGPNRINQFTIKKTSYAIGQLLLDKIATPKIVIAYDTRHQSDSLAKAAADVFTGMGIETFLAPEPMSTPLLSFAVRHYQADAGIVITASHNPKEYNGYKVYNQHGGQILPQTAKQIIEKGTDFPGYAVIEDLPHRPDLLLEVGEEVLATYLSNFSGTNSLSKDLKVVYSSLHGTGLKPMEAILGQVNLLIVESQKSFDGDFPTVTSPNPEDRRALNIAIELAEAEKADLVLATDPDADRIGVAVNHQGEFISLTGNQIGALLVDYLVKTQDIQNKIVAKTIVTNDLGANIALNHGAKIVNTLTGFKYIGNLMTELENENKLDNFLIGYEESYGYLCHDLVQDKDGIASAWSICQMASFWLGQGKTLIHRLADLYQDYGYFLDDLATITLQGMDGAKRIDQLMTLVRSLGTNVVQGVETIKDYQKGIDNLPQENVVKFFLDDQSWFAVRPSGTEPKIKFYFSIQGDHQEVAETKLQHLKEQLSRNLDINL